MSTEAEGSSMFFDPISLEEVSSKYAIQIKNETFNIHTLLDWMANDTDFGVKQGNSVFSYNQKFINPATAKPFSTQEIKQIYEFGMEMGLISNKYYYFDKYKNKKDFLKAELNGTNEDFSIISSKLALDYLKSLKNYYDFLVSNIKYANNLFKEGKKISSYKGQITRTINNFNRQYSDFEIEQAGFNEKDYLSVIDLKKKIDEQLDIRASW